MANTQRDQSIEKLQRLSAAQDDAIWESEWYKVRDLASQIRTLASNLSRPVVRR